MLDPLFDAIKKLFAATGLLLWQFWRLLTSPFRWIANLYRNSGWILRILLGCLLIPIAVGYLWFFWHAAWIRDFDTNYPDKLGFSDQTVAGGGQVAVEGGSDTTRSCAQSNIVKATSHLIDFNVNRNQWLSSNPLYKTGFFWVLDWDQTWFMDNKAAFQRGVHQAAGRTAIELADVLGRTRGTSQIDPDLKDAKGNIQFNQYTWYFNPFDSQPFGPTTRSQTYYRRTIRSLEKYNTRLKGCTATFDARADNLLQFFDRIAKDIGSTSAVIRQRSENYNAGWFDTRADDIFMYAQGQLYAYYGIMKASRHDFQDIIRQRELSSIWDLMEDHLKRAIELDPLIISNGREDGWLMPTHLATLGFYILRARANMVEIRSVLDR